MITVLWEMLMAALRRNHGSKSADVSTRKLALLLLSRYGWVRNYQDLLFACRLILFQGGIKNLGDHVERDESWPLMETQYSMKAGFLVWS